MQIKIHRGINQIGGCITEIKSKKARILIDVGTNYINGKLYGDVDFDNVSDENNFVTSIHPYFYSKNLKEFTEKLARVNIS